MITKLEAGHWYKEPNGNVWMYLRYDEYANIKVMLRSGTTTTLRYAINLTTLVEVCYVDGEEMIVGEEYSVTATYMMASEHRVHFVCVVQGFPYFQSFDTTNLMRWPKWKLVSPVPTYHLVKSIDGQEVSRVEVSGEKAKELGE